jgi:DNA-binding CsgD family transcriptional regulator
VSARPAVASGRRDRSPLDGLTATELNIARQVAQGRTNKQIAETMGRSPHTVDSHLRKIFQKTGVNNRNALTHLLARLDPS